MLPEKWDESKQLVVGISVEEFLECACAGYEEALRVARKRIVDEWPYVRKDLEGELRAHPEKLDEVLATLEEPWIDPSSFFYHILAEVASQTARRIVKSYKRPIHFEIGVDGSVSHHVVGTKEDESNVVASVVAATSIHQP